MSTLLRVKREGMDVSLREMARRVGVSPAFLSDLERGNRSASRAVRNAICDEYDIEAGDAFVSIAVRYSYRAKEECEAQADE